MPTMLPFQWLLFGKALYLYSLNPLVSCALVPVYGTLARYRATYHPEVSPFDSDVVDDSAPRTSPAVHSYFGIMERVHKIEGWAGLYKGIMPTLLTAICVAPVSLATLVIHLHLNGNKLVRGLPGAICLSLLHTIVALPIVVITNRSTITPYRLHLFNPALALRILLTPTERRRPWRLYLTPGLFLSQFIHLLLFLALRDMRLVFIPDGIILGGPSHSEIIWWKVAFFAVMFVQITIMFLVPLEVIATRLAIQRNRAFAEFNSVEGYEDVAESYSDLEDVVRLRNGYHPYGGLRHAGRCIVAEEGWAALYRGLWLTLISILVML